MTDTNRTFAETLDVVDLHREYPAPGGPLRVLQGVSLTMSPGESLAVIGPSGSGKSTLLNILGTLDEPTRGSVRLGGVDPFALGRSELARFRSRRIGFVFQDHHLLGQCTAMENLLVASLARGSVTHEDCQRAAELLQRVGLSDRAGYMPSELSGGQRQRVAIARALMNGPVLLLCDEPTGNLDVRSAASVTAMLLSLVKESGAMLVMATHAPAVAEQMALRRRLEEGRLVDDCD